MIDLHAHILPALDDGAPDFDASIELARLAVEDGIGTVVATPHVNSRYQYDLADIPRRTGELNIHLARREIPLAVLSGAEVALARLDQLSDETLRGLCLGPGPCLLVESPHSSTAPPLEDPLLELQRRGFQPVLAHPERCAMFQQDIGRLRTLVERGVLCSMTAGSMVGVFGSTVQRFALRLLSEGLVHDVASDAHDRIARAPRLRTGFEHAEEELPGILAQRTWFTFDAPTAILAGEPLPAPPKPIRLRPAWRRRLRGR